MASASVHLYVHFVWGTWDRLPVITPEIEQLLHKVLRAKCHERNCQVRAIGGVADHVHVLVRMPATIDIATIAHDMKGASSHLIRIDFPAVSFRWQGAYAAFSVCPSAVTNVADYIENQKEHHRSNRLNTEWEQPPSTEH